MRRAFIETLTELARDDPRVVLLTGDLGYTVLEPFSDSFPSRFFNVGVAEQNMMAIATGLAEAGFVPFTYSIATFATLRCLEFIRNGPVLHRLPVRIVGVGGGFEYGAAGPTHHAIEDVGVLRHYPDLHIVAPADSAQAQAALRATWSLPGPIYFRLGKDETYSVSGLEGRYEHGRAQSIRDGDGLLIVALGAAVREAVEAERRLAAEGISCTVLVVSSLTPPPLEDLAGLLPRFDSVLTLEGHSIRGGLGSLVAEFMAETGAGARLLRCGIDGPLGGPTGSQHFHHRVQRIDADGVVHAARRLIGERA